MISVGLQHPVRTEQVLAEVRTERIRQDIKWGEQKSLAWAAGLFEGEGTFSLHPRKERPKSKPQASSVLRSTDEDVVRRFATVVGVGSVAGPFEPAPNGTKPFWQWCAKGYQSVSQVVVLLWPWLGDRRRRRAIEVLQQCAMGQNGKKKREEAEYKNARLVERLLAETDIPIDDSGLLDAADTYRVAEEVVRERARQDRKWSQQNHDPFHWLAILEEEHGEVARAINEWWHRHPEHLKQYRKELLEVAAVAVAAVESLDRGLWEVNHHGQEETTGTIGTDQAADVLEVHHGAGQGDDDQARLPGGAGGLDQDAAT